MIDLKKDQLLTEPVKCWVKDEAGDRWFDRWLVGISNGLYRTIKNVAHSDNVDILDMFSGGVTTWLYCMLTNPNLTELKPEPKRWLTVEDVPDALWGKTWVKHESRPNSYADILTPTSVSTPDGVLCPGYVWSDDVNPINATWYKMQDRLVKARPLEGD